MNIQGVLAWQLSLKMHSMCAACQLHEYVYPHIVAGLLTYYIMRMAYNGHNPNKYFPKAKTIW